MAHTEFHCIDQSQPNPTGDWQGPQAALSVIRNCSFTNEDVQTAGVFFDGCLFKNCTFNAGSKNGIPSHGPLAAKAVLNCVFINSGSLNL